MDSLASTMFPYDIINAALERLETGTMWEQPTALLASDILTIIGVTYAYVTILLLAFCVLFNFVGYLLETAEKVIVHVFLVLGCVINALITVHVSIFVFVDTVLGGRVAKHLSWARLDAAVVDLNNLIADLKWGPIRDAGLDAGLDAGGNEPPMDNAATEQEAIVEGTAL